MKLQRGIITHAARVLNMTPAGVSDGIKYKRAHILKIVLQLQKEYLKKRADTEKIYKELQNTN